WSGINVGEGVLEIVPGEPVGDRPVFRAISTARSNKFFSVFYKVRDRVESVIDAEGFFPHRIVIDQSHGPRKRYKEIHFDQDDHRATLLYKDRETKYDVPPRVQDSLSSFYFFRNLPELEVGKSYFIDVHASKKNFKMEVMVLKSETIETVLGKIPTIKVKAEVRYEGLLYNKGDLFIWVTDDKRRIPVMMKGKAKIGSITATLIEAEPFQLRPAGGD
ncbi:MAG TPA: DUF3108 domain-containing protein, partial [Nitrospiria bacterium]